MPESETLPQNEAENVEYTPNGIDIFYNNGTFTKASVAIGRLLAFKSHVIENVNAEFSLRYHLIKKKTLKYFKEIFNDNV